MRRTLKASHDAVLIPFCHAIVARLLLIVRIERRRSAFGYREPDSGKGHTTALMSPMPSQPNDPFDLERFLEAQEANYRQALSELRAGLKQSHWSWYVLPQVTGLGTSPMSIRFSIRSLAEARAYLEHPILGARLRECVAAINAHTGLSASQILGEIDAQKFRSCLTLFTLADSSEPVFGKALRKYFSGEPDAATLRIVAGLQGK